MVRAFLRLAVPPPWTVANHLIELGANSVTTINYRDDLIDHDVTDFIRFRNIDARKMSMSIGETYDLIFGIAVLEHLPNLEVVLSEATSLLRPNGMVALHGAAFWSTKLGHHVFVHVDGARYEFNGNNPVDDYSHLYFDESQMHDDLVRNKGLPDHHATAICDYIYRDPILNRYYYEDIVGAYSRARQEIVSIRSAEWGSPDQNVVERIKIKIGPYFSQIYENFSCGEMLVISCAGIATQIS